MIERSLVNCDTIIVFSLVPKISSNVVIHRSTEVGRKNYIYRKYINIIKMRNDVPFNLLISSCRKTALIFVDETSTVTSSNGSHSFACLPSSSSSWHCAASNSLSFASSPLHKGQCAVDVRLLVVSIYSVIHSLWLYT